MRILVAEDEQEIAKALKKILEKERYAVDVVYNGRDAMDYIHQIDYDAYYGRIGSFETNSQRRHFYTDTFFDSKRRLR